MCGGKNWDDDVSSAQCWRYDHCSAVWRHELDLPLGLHGGASVRTVSGDQESLWLVGGGNTTAFNHVFVRQTSPRLALLTNTCRDSLLWPTVGQ